MKIPFDNRLPDFQYGMVEKIRSYEQFNDPTPGWLTLTGTKSVTIDGKMKLQGSNATSSVQSQVSIQTEMFYLENHDALRFRVNNVRSNVNFASRGIALISEDGNTVIEYKTKSQSSEIVGLYVNGTLVKDIQVVGVTKFKFNGELTGQRSNCYEMQILPSKNSLTIDARNTETVSWDYLTQFNINWAQRFYFKFYMMLSTVGQNISMDVAQIETKLSTTY